MLMGSNLNPYKKLLEQQDFLPLKGKKGVKRKFKIDYDKFQKHILKNEDFKYLDFKNNQEEIKEIVENYINEITKRNHDYMETDDYLNNMIDGIGQEDFNEYLNENYLKLDDIFYDEFYEQLNDRGHDYSLIIKEFWNENKGEFDISFTISDYLIGEFYQEEDTYSHYFNEYEKIEIFGRDYNFIDLMYYFPTDFIKSLDLEDDINDDIIQCIKDKDKQFDIQFTHYYGYNGINLYLENYDEIKDLFKQYLIDNHYLGIKSEDNTIWEEEE